MKLKFETLHQFEEVEKMKQEIKEGIDLSFFINQRQEMTMDDGIATIHIHGSLGYNLPPVYELLGSTSYQTIEADIQQALAQGAKGILFHVQSGGGGVNGCAELAELVENLPVPTLAYSDTMACSAAYKLSCGCDAVMSSPTAQMGNIGSVLVWVDDSKLLERVGVEIKAISNDGADLKTTFHAGVSESQLEFLQESINESGKSFQDFVTRNRDVSEEVFRAGWYSGQRAVELGLVDGIGSIADARETLMEMVEFTDR